MGLARYTSFMASGLISAAVAMPSSTAAASGSDWAQTAQRMATVLPGLQRVNGTFPAYNYAKASGELPYGESMVGYGLLDAGIAASNGTEIHAGLRALAFASGALLRRGSRSVFENLALAAAYNRARLAIPDDPVFKSIRPGLELALRAIKPVWSGSGRRYFNKYLVEAVAWLELIRSGLHSSVRGSVLSNPAHARAVVARLINHQIGSSALGFKYSGRGSMRALILSDPPDNPAAYQGLSLGMMARAMTLLGPAASPHAWRVLRAVATASWELSGPDGDLAYFGRSQEEAWALGLTAYGAEVATERAADSERGRDRALAATAMKRLYEQYPVGRRGLWITPAVAQNLNAAKRGLDRYADSVAYTGLALVAANWAASVENTVAAGAMAGDTVSSYVIGQDTSRIAVVRTRYLWFAVKQARSHQIDLRYDFGLVAMKAQQGTGSWANVIPSLPEVRRTPDSTGPVLRTNHGQAYPTGRRIAVAPDGSVTVTGSSVTASGHRLRSRVFRFQPAGSCVTFSFALRRGEHVADSAFVRRVDRVSTAGVSGPGERVSVAPAAASVTVDRSRYSSGSDASLRRVRFSFQTTGEIRITTCADR